MTTKFTKELPAAGVFLRTQWNYDHNAASNACGLSCQEPTRAQQHHKSECDINEILRRFGKTGQMPVNAIKGTFGDFSNAVDYHTAMNALIASESEFDALPSNIRKRFDNDPYELVKFIENPENFNEGVELGLFAPKTAAIAAPEVVKNTVTDPLE
jgi:phage internal scaffolding protein